MPKVSKYITHILPKLELIEAWYRNGAIDKDVAHNLGVGYSTYLKYKNEYPELKERTVVFKEEADLKVESSLFRNALGHDYTEEVAIKCKDSYYDSKGKRVEKEHVEVVEVRKHKPADTTAQIIWLKNRKPNEWRDSKQVEHSGSINNPFENISTEDIKKLIENG